MVHGRISTGNTNMHRLTSTDSCLLPPVFAILYNALTSSRLQHKVDCEKSQAIINCIPTFI